MRSTNDSFLNTGYFSSSELLFSDLFLFNKYVLHAYHGIVPSAEGYDIKNELVLAPPTKVY